MVSPSVKRQAVKLVVSQGLCSERRALRYLGLARSSGRYVGKPPGEWLNRLREAIRNLSKQRQRLGYRKVSRILRKAGWKVGRKLVQRLRRELGLRVKRWQPKQRRWGRSTGIIPTKAGGLNQVWSWDFVADRTDNGGKLRILSVIDEYSRECLALQVDRRLTAQDLIEVLERLIIRYGTPAHIRSDNGPEFIALKLQQWLKVRNIKTLYIEPGSPWQNGHVESFNGSLRDECLNRELILSVAEARVLAEDYRRHYNTERPHGGIGYQTPAEFARETQALGSSRPAGSFHQELAQSTIFDNLIYQPT
jgi:transposase InsO family protein